MVHDREGHGANPIGSGGLSCSAPGWQDDRHMQDFFYGWFTYDGRGPA